MSVLDLKQQRIVQISLSATAAALLAYAIPAVNQYITHENCVATHGTPAYTFLPDALNEALCAFNVVFSGAYSTRGGVALLGEFGGFFASAALILVYEYGVTGIVTMLIGQIVPICIVYPAFTALGLRKRTPTPLQAWTSLIAVTIGYIVTGVVALHTNLGHGPLSLWQIYPVLILVLLPVLRPILRLLPLDRLGPKWPVIAIASVGISTSAAAHFPLFRAFNSGDINLQDVFSPTSKGFAGASQWIFVVDFAIVAASVAFSVLGSVEEEKFSAQTVGFFILHSLAIGPGAAVMFLWASTRLEM